MLLTGEVLVLSTLLTKLKTIKIWMMVMSWARDFIQGIVKVGVCISMSIDQEKD